MPTVRPSRDSVRAASVFGSAASGAQTPCAHDGLGEPGQERPGDHDHEEHRVVAQLRDPGGQTGDDRDRAETDGRPARVDREDEPPGGDQHEAGRDREAAEDRQPDDGRVVGRERHHDRRDRREGCAGELHVPHFEAAGGGGFCHGISWRERSCRGRRGEVPVYFALPGVPAVPSITKSARARAPSASKNAASSGIHRSHRDR